MDALLKALRNFLTRDMVYFIGGFFVLLTFSAFIGKAELLFLDHALATWAFLLGLSYALGFGVQELFCMAGILTTSAAYQPKCWLMTQIYRLYVCDAWHDIQDVNQDQWFILINQNASAKNHDEIERMVCLLLLCTTLGSCATVSALLLLLPALISLWLPQHFPPPTRDVLIVGMAALFAGIVFMVASRIKAAEHTRFVHALYLHLLQQNGTTDAGANQSGPPADN